MLRFQNLKSHAKNFSLNLVQDFAELQTLCSRCTNKINVSGSLHQRVRNQLALPLIYCDTYKANGKVDC